VSGGLLLAAINRFRRQLREEVLVAFFDTPNTPATACGRACGKSQEPPSVTPSR
jgi:hypothetical protein